MRKKASVEEQVFLTLTELVLVASVSLILWNHVGSFKDNTLLDARYISRDLALVLNTIYAAPGNIYYNYDYDLRSLDNFDFFFADNEENTGNVVGVANSKNTDEEKKTKDFLVQYPYGGGDLLKNLHILRSPDEVFFYKTGGEISNHRDKSLNLLDCNRINAKVDTNKVVFNFIYNTDAEKELLKRIRANIESAVSNINSEFIETNAKEKLIEEDKEKYKDASIIIIITLSGEGKEFDFVKSRYLYNKDSFLRNKLLGCVLLNSFIEQEPRLFDLEIANIPKEKSYFENILSATPDEKTSVVEVELGINQNYAEYVVSKPISEGLKKYA